MNGERSKNVVPAKAGPILFPGLLLAGTVPWRAGVNVAIVVARPRGQALALPDDVLDHLPESAQAVQVAEDELYRITLITSGRRGTPRAFRRTGRSGSRNRSAKACATR